MFYYLKGELAYRDINTCVVDCGGVAYKMTVSYNTSDALLTKLGKEVKDGEISESRHKSYLALYETLKAKKKW